MNDPQKTRQSTTEILRKPISFAIAGVLVVLLIVTRPAGFETVLYEVLEQLGFILVFIAVLGRIWCTLYIAGRKNKQLCTVGPYSLCRNPLYFFSFLGLIGICFTAQNLLLAATAAIAYLLYYRGVIRGEERRLAAIFNADFDHYVASTPRFWPALKIPRDASILEVNCSIFNRSLREVIWFLLAIVFVEIIGHLKSGHVFTGIVLPI